MALQGMYGAAQLASERKYRARLGYLSERDRISALVAAARERKRIHEAEQEARHKEKRARNIRIGAVAGGAVLGGLGGLALAPATAVGGGVAGGFMGGGAGAGAGAVTGTLASVGLGTSLGMAAGGSIAGALEGDTRALSNLPAIAQQGINWYQQYGDRAAVTYGQAAQQAYQLMLTPSSTIVAPSDLTGLSNPDFGIDLGDYRPPQPLGSNGLNFRM